jgi:hypothetical protein
MTFDRLVPRLPTEESFINISPAVLQFKVLEVKLMFETLSLLQIFRNWFQIYIQDAFISDVREFVANQMKNEIVRRLLIDIFRVEVKKEFSQ